MRSYREIASFLLIRRQLALGWKIGFLIVCGALLYGSLTLTHVRLRSSDILGTVISRSSSDKEENVSNELLVKLDTGETVRAGTLSKHEFLPGRRVVVKETTTNFFGMRKYEIKSYASEINRQ